MEVRSVLVRSVNDEPGVLRRAGCGINDRARVGYRNAGIHHSHAGRRRAGRRHGKRHNGHRPESRAQDLRVLDRDDSGRGFAVDHLLLLTPVQPQLIEQIAAAW